MIDIVLCKNDFVGNKYSNLEIIDVNLIPNCDDDLWVTWRANCCNDRGHCKLSDLAKNYTNRCYCSNKQRQIDYEKYIGKTCNNIIISDVIRGMKKGAQIYAVCSCGNHFLTSLDGINSSNPIQSCGCLSNKRNPGKMTNIFDTHLKKYNEYDLINSFAVCVKFSNCNENFICDRYVWKYFRKFNWWKDPKGYALTWLNGKNMRFHKMLLYCPENFVIDHINQNKLDNRYENLRILTNQENTLNRAINENNTSGTNGVYYETAPNKWVAHISIGNYNMLKKKFDTKEEAIQQRLLWEQEYYNITTNIQTEHLILPNGEINTNFPFEKYNFSYNDIL